MHGLLVALLYSGIAPLVHLRLLYALADSCQDGLYFFFGSGYHVVVFFAASGEPAYSSGNVIKVALHPAGVLRRRVRYLSAGVAMPYCVVTT